jgi:hypothetical protein
VEAARAYHPAAVLAQAPWCRSTATDSMTERILILDFGSQYAQLIGANTTTCRRF